MDAQEKFNQAVESHYELCTMIDFCDPGDIVDALIREIEEE